MSQKGMAGIMTTLEVCLIVVGIVAIAISYFISDKNADERMQKAVEKLVLSEETKQSLMKQTRDTVEKTLNGMSEEIAEKAEIQLEKLSTEKIMAVHDYSDTVLDEIGKNHNEVMFLYSMLDDKGKEVKDTVKEAQKAVKSMHSIKRAQASQMEQLSDKTEQNSEKGNQDKGEKNETEALSGIIEKNEVEALLGKTEKEQSLKEGKPEEFAKSEDKRKDSIIEFYEQGKSNIEIAKELGLGIGEVKLVISLYHASEESKGNVE